MTTGEKLDENSEAGLPFVQSCKPHNTNDETLRLPFFLDPA
jgi:hypothetical protein